MRPAVANKQLINHRLREARVASNLIVISAVAVMMMMLMIVMMR